MKRIFVLGAAVSALCLSTRAHAGAGPINALDLNGATAFAQAPAGVWFNGDFTVEAWVFCRSYNNWSRLIDFADGPNLTNVYVALTAGSGGYPTMGVFANTGTPILTATTQLPTNQWAHLAATVHGTTGTIYINGVAVGTGVVNAAPNNLRTNNYIGRSNYAADGYANAIFDDVRIWNVARTQSQIQAFMHHSLAGTEPGLVGYWRLDEGVGTNAADSTGNGHTLDLVGGAKWTNSSAPLTVDPGTALAFANNDDTSYVSLTNSAAFNALPLSVSAWVNSSSGHYSGIVDKMDFSNNQEEGFLVYLYNNYLFAAYYRNNGDYAFVQDQNQLGGGWHHIVVTVDANQIMVYVNGSLHAHNGWYIIVPPTATTSTTPASIGHFHQGSLGQNPGTLDEVSFWNVALTAAQVSGIYSNGLTGAEAGLLALYHFDEGAGALVVDASGNNRNGALLGNLYSWVPSGVPVQSPRPATLAATIPAINGPAATLKGAAIANGNNTVTWFDWGSNIFYGNTTLSNAIGSGENWVAFSNVVSGIQPGRIYHYRAKGTNVAGLNVGADQLLQEPLISLSGGASVVWPQGLPWVDPGAVLAAPPPQIFAGPDHALALKADGAVVGWGDNSSGESSQPAGVSNLVGVACGGLYSLGLKSDGTVFGWGNSYNNRFPPAGLSNIVAIAAGNDNSVALQNNGTVFDWGVNGYGETNIPASATNVVAVAAGFNHVLALRGDGTVTAWGDNTIEEANVPAGLSNVVAIAAGYQTSLALKSNGAIAAWGSDYASQLSSLASLSNVIEIAAGEDHTAVLFVDGTVQAFGDDTFGQTDVPADATNIVAITANNYYTVATRADGAVIEWGLNTYSPSSPPSGLSAPAGVITVKGTVNVNVLGTYPVTYTTTNYLGQVGTATRQVAIAPKAAPSVLTLPASFNGTSNTATLAASVNPNSFDTVAWFEWGTSQGHGSRTAPMDVGGGSSPVAVASTINGLLPGVTYHYRVVATNLSGSSAGFDQVTRSWVVALNGASQVTNYVGVPWSDPGAALQALPVALSGGWDFGIALKADGSVEGWGGDDYRQINVPPGLDARAVAAGSLTVVAAPTNGPAVAWGFVPYSIPDDTTNFTEVTVSGNGFMVGLRSNGTVRAWGNPSSPAATNVPANTSNVVQIATGVDDAVALLNDGTARSWGLDSSASNALAALTGVRQLAAGTSFTLALKNDGSLAQTGEGPNGEPLPADLTNIVSICAGIDTCYAIQSDGTVAQWGYTPGAIPDDLTNTIMLGAGFYFAMALTADGRMEEWGQTLPYYGDPPAPPNDLNLISGPVNITGSVDVNTPGSYTLTYSTTNEFGAVSTATRAVVVVLPPAPFATGTTLQSDGTLVLQFRGVGGLDYTLQGSTNLVDWQAITNLPAGVDGTFAFTNGVADDPIEFYRLRYP